MKTTKFLSFAALSSVALAKIKVEARFSNEMVDVGNVDLRKVTWEEIFASTGNERNVVHDNTYEAFANPCTHDSAAADRHVRVNINGQWGRSLWAILNDVSKPRGFDVFAECFGTTWQKRLPQWAYKVESACGGVTNSVSADCKCDIGSAACRSHSWSHRVPSVIKVNLYDMEGALLADSLTVNFASEVPESTDGCGFAAAVAGAVAGFIPGAGSLFDAGIELACES